MPRAKRSIESTVTIDGHSLVWRLHREQQGSTSEGWRGMAIHVRVAEGARRELHMEYPAVETHKNGFTRIGIDYSPRPGIVATKVEAHVREAIAAGWDPDSRGKPFVYQVGELPS
jgi:hypothetical protein